MNIEKLIPFAKLASMGAPGVLLLLGILGVTLFTLTKGANWLVEGAAQLSYRLGIPKIIVGATVVSLGTTSPEAAVSVMSALQGQPGLALGNALGSVICDTGLIFGLSCLITRLPLDRFILNRHGWLQFGSGVLLVGLIVLSWVLTGRCFIARWMGILLLALLVSYMFISVRWAKQHPDLLDEQLPAPTHAVGLCLLMILGGLALVVISSKILIADVQQLCLLMSVPQSIVSGTIVAFGTSLPELVTALTSIKKGHPELLIGNVIGADILNILFVVGASAAAVAADANAGTPGGLEVPKEMLYLHIPAMLAILLLFRIFIATNKKTFRRACGIPLLAVYVAYVTIAYLTGIGSE